LKLILSFSPLLLFFLLAAFDLVQFSDGGVIAQPIELKVSTFTMAGALALLTSCSPTSSAGVHNP
jgi:hypothetical protein